jgi:hypothetical protein
MKRTVTVHGQKRSEENGPIQPFELLVGRAWRDGYPLAKSKTQRIV